jgi:hypothetical protein
MKKRDHLEGLGTDVIIIKMDLKETECGGVDGFK